MADHQRGECGQQQQAPRRLAPRSPEQEQGEGRRAQHRAVEIVDRDAERGSRVGHAASGSNSRSLRPVLPSDMRSGSGSAKRSANHIEAAAISPSSGSENRSEEHTSELQSLMRISYAVFCLKQKKNK